jgi:hypothetical protein
MWERSERERERDKDDSDVRDTPKEKRCTSQCKCIAVRFWTF